MALQEPTPPNDESLEDFLPPVKPEISGLKPEISSLKPQDLIRQTMGLVQVYYWRHKTVPTQKDLNREFPTEPTSLDAVLASPKAVESLIALGVPINPLPAITPRQLRWIQRLLDANDNTPWPLKLKKANVTAEQHDAWLRQPLFAQVLREEGAKLLDSHKATILAALARRANAGDNRAIRTALELTGDIAPNPKSSASEADVVNFMKGVIEILQLHVEPATLVALQADFEFLLTHGYVRPVTTNNFAAIEAFTPND